MSLSTLGAQLAALNNGNTNGSALPSSRRQDDAIGRGLYHNVQVGHSEVSTLKASILYPDARQASNVPLTTLEDNCVASLQELQVLDAAFGEYIPKLCPRTTTGQSNWERGLQTKAHNEQMDQLIQDLVYRLALRMSASSTTEVDTVTCGLNIVEFLMRQYDLHLRPKLVSTMLLAWLPHHEHAYYMRFLQIVDLANLPTYSWLRPFATPHAKVGRAMIAKAASKNLALCRDLLVLTAKAATLPEADATLAFTAAVWVEAMTLQQHSKGTVEERTCQALLPMIRRACLAATKNALLANWGYIMASTLVETSCLADEPRKAVITSILQGLSNANKNKRKDDHDDESDKDDMDVDGTTNESGVDDGMIQNGLIVVVSLLQQQPPISVDITNDHDGKDSKITCQLPVGDSKKVLYGYRNASCINDKTIWQALLELDNLPSRLSRLLVKDGFVDVLHWIVSLWVVGWKRLEKARRKSSSKSSPKKNLRLEQFLHELLEDPNLSQHVWTKPQWIQAMVCFILTNTSIDDGKMASETAADNKTSRFLDSTLHVLRRMDMAEYDRGIAQALLQLNRKQRHKLAAYLGLIKDENDPVSIGNPSEAETGINLPLRVALEHADIEIRREAMDRVLAQEESEDGHGGETLVEALMRRVVADDDVDVVVKASKALCQILDGKKKKGSNDKEHTNDHVGFAKDALQALYKWTEYSQVEHKSKAALLAQLLHLVAYAAMKIQGDSELFVGLIEAIGAFLVHGDTTIVKDASKGIILAITSKKVSKASDNEAREILLSHDIGMLQQFARKTDALTNPSQHIFRRRFLPSLLKGYAETLSHRSNKTDVEKATAALDYCLWCMTMHAKSLSTDDMKLLLDVLNRTVVDVSANPKRLASVVGIVLDADESIYEEVCLPFIMEVCKTAKDKNGESVAGIALISEMALDPSFGPDHVERLLAVAEKLVEANTCHFGLVPALALMTSPEASIRKKTLSLVSTLGKHLEIHPTEEWRPFSEICNYLSGNHSSAVMGSPVLLAECLRATISQSKNAKSVYASLLKLVLNSITAASERAPVKEMPSNTRGLEFGGLTGAHAAALTILTAIQDAGDVVFPLITRWSNLGKPVLDFLLQSELQNASPSTSALMDHIVLMLKGRKFFAPSEEGLAGSNVIIMSGPGSRGGRKRSYSFGKTEASNFLHPYPKDMTDTIVALLSASQNGALFRQVRSTLTHHILASESWGQNVFSSLSSVTRKQIVRALLHTTTNDLAADAEEAFFALPIPCHDLAQLLETLRSGEEDLAFTTYIADYSNANSKKLSLDPAVVEVIVGLLDKFTALSSKDTEDGEGIEYARTSLLDALIAIFEAQPDEARAKLSLNKKTKFKDWVSTFAGVVGSTAQSNYRPVASTRSKKSALSVMTCLSSLYPAAMTERLIMAVVAMVSTATSEKEASVVADCLGSIVPVYLDCSSAANLSASDMIDAFIAASNGGIENTSRAMLYQGFVDSISKDTGKLKGDSLGSFLASILAADVFFSCHDGGRSQSSVLLSQMVSLVSVPRRIEAMLSLVSYARDLVLILSGEKTEASDYFVPLDHLLHLTEFGPELEKKKGKRKVASSQETQRKLCTSLMVATCEMLTSPVFARFLRHCKAESSTSVVQLWQDLLLIQSVFNNELGSAKGDSVGFWTSISEATAEALDFIQLHLPSHIFLAFATSLIRESDSEDLRARALQLIASRSLLLDSSDPESGLFLELLPYLTSLLDDSNASGHLVQQSAFVAIEHIIRKGYLKNDGNGANYLDQVAQALIKSAHLLDKLCKQDVMKLSMDRLDNAVVQLLCTAVLCAATAVRACGARSLPVLPQLLKPSVTLLGDVNGILNGPSKDGSDDSQARILQLSLLRLMSSVVDTIPQFLVPYISDMFLPNVLPSPALRQTHDEQSASIADATTKLCTTISAKVPARQLLSPLTSAVLKSDSPHVITTLLETITTTVKNAKPSDVGVKANSILQAGTFVFDYALDRAEQNELVDSGAKMFMAMVLKLSELQLRSLYSKLRAWRGDFDKSKPAVASFKRYCFWLLSAKLGSQLKSIFLPCLSSVFPDAVDELDAAVRYLCKRSDVKTTSGGSKKQRLEVESLDYDNSTLLSLQAVLMCLEASLRSDAHDGGAWIRDGESQRFDLLLEPLGKMLHCRVEKKEAGLSYQELVQGSKGESGSVVECIVALALAAGDELKWKPLNHAVLQSCSHETRPEVRKAGITCLLSLIKSIGEEYMVLIPECLPVLSELLEDTDEEIAGSAQECITISEDLLGESLEESLR